MDVVCICVLIRGVCVSMCVRVSKNMTHMWRSDDNLCISLALLEIGDNKFVVQLRVHEAG